MSADLLTERRTINVAALLDGSSWSRYQKLLTALTAIAIIFDGFDIQILGFAIPPLYATGMFPAAHSVQYSHWGWRAWLRADRWEVILATGSAAVSG